MVLSCSAVTFFALAMAVTLFALAMAVIYQLLCWRRERRSK
jgi:hypothetical protein